MWTLTGSMVRLETQQLQLEFDLRYPHRGLTIVRVATVGAVHERVPVHPWFRVHLAGSEGGACTVLESYVRGPDLVAHYAAAAPGDIQSQIYWRLIQPARLEAVGLELVISVQTEKLDSDPSSGTSTDVTADELWPLDEQRQPERCDLWPSAGTAFRFDCRQGVFLFRLPGSELSYLEMVHPSDASHGCVEAGQAGDHPLRTFFRLFSERLEKGVIRRGRVRGLFIPRQNDTRDALAAYREFRMSAPPLTT